MKEIYSRQGFTLVELMVVIGTLCIIATLVVISFNGSRIHARDTQRVHNIREIQSALELYYNRYHLYPTLITTGQTFANNGVSYIDPVPSNPTPRTDGGCPNTDYTYSVGSGNGSYNLIFCLGTATGSLSSGNNICTNNTCSSGYESDAQAYINRVNADGGTVIDPTALQNAILQAKSDGWFTKDGSLLWIAADFGIKTSGGLVVKWYDVFGNDISFASSYRPTYNATGGPNNLPRITWSSGNYGTLTSVNLATTHDNFDVIKQTSNSGYKMLYGESNSNSFVSFLNATSFSYGAHGVGASAVTVTSILNLNKIINFNRNGTTAIHLNINNIAQADATMGSNQNFVFDEYGSYNGGALGFVGDRIETIISKNYLNAYRSLIMTYLNTKYAIY